MVLIDSHLVKQVAPETRLSDYLHFAFEVIPSRSSGNKKIKKGLVKVDGQIATTGIIVKPGMVIQLYRDALSDLPKNLPSPKILFEDDHIIVGLKPAGIATSGYSRDHLLARMQSYVKTEVPVKTVHRLDKATSGIVLFAKDSISSAGLSDQFKQGLIEKTYTAIVCGKMGNSGMIQLPIEGKESLTHFNRLEIFPSSAYDSISLVQLTPKTGRKHQLRKHMKAIGHPIVGDHLYGMEGRITKGKGMCLVANKIRFRHPLNNRLVTIEIDIPKNFRKVLPS